ncbi:UNKNOWN [Stylonychia lemnae]|uniref:Uncharacterized protein n=1 Tax=Stylonychia lemnae TaxID=5949 RepID=A0A078A4H6_STYLE|nr:UNKNOWN [Stylonychia lemnae]|eukprot:CDW77158.1 UNKNOWN [Stylonychia lemnae]
MPKINLNVVIVCGSQVVDLPKFVDLLTESYLPNVQVTQQNGCTVTRTVLKPNNLAIFDEVSQQDHDGQLNNDLTNLNNSNQKDSLKGSFKGENNDSRNSLDKYELDICFWDMNPKEHLWSRLKSLELFETANILLMVYNADDRDSYDKIKQIHADFKEQNKVGAYQVLISVITADLKLKKTQKAVKKTEAQEFIEDANIPSYLEVRLDNKQNLDILDQHLRIIMNPPINMLDHPEEDDYLYRPLFEVIQLKKIIKRKKKKKVNEKWVSRLYYTKTDYSMISRSNQSTYSQYSDTSSNFNSSRILHPNNILDNSLNSNGGFSISNKNSATRNKKLNKNPSASTVLQKIPEQQFSQESYQDLQSQLQQNNLQFVKHHSVINLQMHQQQNNVRVAEFLPDIQVENEDFIQQLQKQTTIQEEEEYDSSDHENQELNANFQNHSNQLHLHQGSDDKRVQNNSGSILINQLNPETFQFERTNARRQTMNFKGLTSPPDKNLSNFSQISRIEENNSNYQSKHLDQSPHAVKCPYHAKTSRSKSPGDRNELLYPDLKQYVANNFKAAKAQRKNEKSDSKLKFDINSPSVFDKNVKLRRRDASDNNRGGPRDKSPILNFKNQNNKNAANANNIIGSQPTPTSKRDSSPNFLSKTQNTTPNYYIHPTLQESKISKGDDERLDEFRKKLLSLQSNATTSGTTHYIPSSKNQHKTKKTATHETVYIQRDYIPVEQHYSYKPEKDRGYGCQNCSIF